jgi:hypothetical protein
LTCAAAAAKPAVLSQPAEFVLDRDETEELALKLTAGEYLVTIDTRRADSRLGNLISKVSLLDGDGAVIRDSNISINVIDYSYRGVSAFELKRPATVRVRVVNSNDKAEFLAVAHALPTGFLIQRNRLDAPVVEVAEKDFPFNNGKAGLMPFPFFAKTAPRMLAVEEDQTGELEEGESAYYAAMLPKADYKVGLGFEQARRQKSNLIGYVALLGGAGEAQQNVVDINAIDVSHTKAGGFALKRGSLVVLRVENRNENKVKYTLRIRKD